MKFFPQEFFDEPQADKLQVIIIIIIIYRPTGVDRVPDTPDINTCIWGRPSLLVLSLIRKTLIA